MKLRNKFKGIAMIESMVAVGVILTAILAPMTVVIASSEYAKLGIERIQATYLANDGAEMVLNFRKSLIVFCFKNPTYGGYCESGQNGDLSISSFNLFLHELTDENGNGTQTCTINSPCVIDPSSFIVRESPAPETNFIDKNDICNFLRQDPVSMTFGCVAGEESIFYRYMYVEALDNNNFLADGTSAGPSGLLITTIVCFDRSEAQCLDQQDPKNKVIIKNYVSK